MQGGGTDANCSPAAAFFLRKQKFEIPTLVVKQVIVFSYFGFPHFLLPNAVTVLVLLEPRGAGLGMRVCLYSWRGGKSRIGNGVGVQSFASQGLSPQDCFSCT